MPENRASTFPGDCRKRNSNGCASIAWIEFDRLQFGDAMGSQTVHDCVSRLDLRMAPAAPAPHGDREQRDDEPGRDRFGHEPSAGPVDGARPQRGRFAGARQAERHHDFPCAPQRHGNNAARLRVARRHRAAASHPDHVARARSVEESQKLYAVLPDVLPAGVRCILGAHTSLEVHQTEYGSPIRQTTGPGPSSGGPLARSEGRGLDGRADHDARGRDEP